MSDDVGAAKYVEFLVNEFLTINPIVAPCIFLESLQFINQRMHI